MKILVKVIPFFSLVLLSINAFAFNCSVTSTSVSFGNYNVFSSAPLDTTGTITLSCSNPEQKPMQVSVSISSGSSGSFYPRQMTGSSGSRMNYYLYLDPSRTAVWGDGSAGTSVLTATMIRNPSLTATVYGRVPARQDVRAGVYTDNLVVTIAW